MFEGYKIKKLVGEIISSPGKDNAKQIKELRKYGPDGLAALVEAFKSAKILGADMRNYLNIFYEKSFLELFMELLGDSKEEVRTMSKEIVEQKAGTGAIPGLIEFLKTGNFLQKRGASDLLKTIGNESTVDKVVPLLHEDQREVKGAALDVVSGIGGSKGTAHIMNLLTSSDWWLRKRAVDALCKLKDPTSVESLINLLNTEKDPKIKSVVITTIGEIGNSDSAKRILPHIMNDDLIVRQMVVEAIEKTGDVEVMEDVIEIMKNADVNVRRAGVEILQKIKDPRATVTLIKRLRDPDWWVREIATDALADLKTPGTNEKIMELFKSKDENVRRAAVEFFKRVPSASAFDSLVELLKDDDWWVREKAVEALGMLKDERAINHIILLVEDPDVRWAVPNALAEIGGQDAIGFLIDFLSDPDRNVRMASLKGLGKIKDKSTLPMIKGAVKDSDSEIRDTALDIIKDMTGHAVKANEIIAEQERQQWKGGSTVISAYVPEKNQILTESILVLDLCNSTEIGAKFGDDFALMITGRLVEATKPIAARNRVRFTKSTGDGYLMTFAELKNALFFARDITNAIIELNKTVPENERIDIRIAINRGETRVDTKGDRLGTAVNKTFRVEGLKPKDLVEDEGGMKPEEMPLVNRTLVTEDVSEELKKMEEFDAKYVGFFDLKGISGRHRIFQMIMN